MTFVGAFRFNAHKQGQANTTIVTADGAVFGVSETFEEICNALDARMVVG